MFPVSSSVAKTITKKKSTIAIIPVPATDELDDINREYSDALRNSLKKKYNVLNLKITNQIIENSKSNQNVSAELGKALTLINEGRDAYVIKNNIKGSLQILKSAEDYLISSVEPSDGTSNAMINSKLTRAWILFETSNFIMSKEVLLELLKVVGNADLKTKGYPRKFQKFVNLTKNESPTVKGSLQIDSIPSSANVYLDGVYQGVTPLKLEIPNGKYRLGIASNGRKSFVKDVRVSSGKNKVIRTNLKWNRSNSTSKKMFGGMIWNEASPSAKIALASHIGNATNVDRIVFLSIEKKGRAYQSIAQVFDKEFNQALKSYPYKKKIKNLKLDSPSVIRYFAKSLNTQLKSETLDLYKNEIDQKFITDQRIASRPKKPIYKKPAFIAAIGGLILTGVVLGVALSSSGGSSSPSTGGVSIDLGGFK